MAQGTKLRSRPKTKICQRRTDDVHSTENDPHPIKFILSWSDVIFNLANERPAAIKICPRLSCAPQTKMRRNVIAKEPRIDTACLHYYFLGQYRSCTHVTNGILINFFSIYRSLFSSKKTEHLGSSALIIRSNRVPTTASPSSNKSCQMKPKKELGTGI